MFVSCVFPCYLSPSYEKNNISLFCFNSFVSSVVNFYITKGQIINYSLLTLIYFQFSFLSFIFPPFEFFQQINFHFVSNVGLLSASIHFVMLNLQSFSRFKKL